MRNGRSFDRTWVSACPGGAEMVPVILLEKGRSRNSPSPTLVPTFRSVLTGFLECGSVGSSTEKEITGTRTVSAVHERLDHLGIVAGVCQESGVANWRDAHEPTMRQHVSVGTATTAMIPRWSRRMVRTRQWSMCEARGSAPIGFMMSMWDGRARDARHDAHACGFHLLLGARGRREHRG